MVRTEQYINVMRRHDTKADATSTSLRGMFHTFDADESGSIDRDEARALCEHLGVDTHGELFEQEWLKMNPNNDSGVTFAEFEAYQGAASPAHLTIHTPTFSTVISALHRIEASKTTVSRKHCSCWRATGDKGPGARLAST